MIFEVLFALLVTWVIITLVGHLSWIILAAIGRAIFQTRRPPESVKQPVDEIAAAHRVVSRMASDLLISPQEARKLRGQIEQLNSRAWRRSSQAATPHPEPLRPRPAHELPAHELPAQEPTSQETSVSQVSARGDKDAQQDSAVDHPGVPLEVASEGASEGPKPRVEQPLVDHVPDQAASPWENLHGFPEVDQPATTHPVQPSGIYTSRTDRQSPAPPISPRASVGKSMAEFLA